MTVQAAAGDTQPPTTPSSLIGTAISGSEVRLTWSASTDNVRVTSYQVLRNGTVLGSSATTSFTDTTVRPTTAYTYQVKALDAEGNVSAAAIAQVSTPAQPAPSTPTTSCAAPVYGAFTGCYYRNTTFTGAPVMVRTDAQIAFRPYGSFPPDAVPIEGFSVRWQGTFAFEGGSYTFSSLASDGMRVYVDGTLVVDNWRDQAPISVITATRNIAAGNHLVSVEYYSRTGRPAAHLSWNRVP